YLMVRAADRPFINEGNPSNWKMFQEYVLRKQYGNTSFVQRRGNFFKDQLNYHFLRYFGMQWLNEPFFTKPLGVTSALLKPIANIFIAFLGVAGAMLQFRKNKHSFWYFFSVILITTVVMVFVMNLSDAEVRDRDYFFVVAYNMWAIWMGIGALALVTLWKSKPVRVVLLIFMCLLPVSNLISQYRVHDRSQEFIALDYGLNFLNSVEENAIIFTNGDNDTFPLWYAQAVEDPYSKENIYHARDVYPTKESKEAIAKAMEYKNKCLKGIRKDVSVANLSLLNTSWYIRQLRDQEGILFNIPDDQLDELEPRRIEKPLVILGPPDNPSMGFTMDIPPTAEWRTNEPFYRVSDLAVMQIVKDNYGKRPIYFAVTCESYVNFNDYVRNEGMVGRIVSTPKEGQIDPERLLHNIDVVYNYRSIEDPRVYKDDNMRRLVMNYGSGFVRAANYYIDTGNYPKALEYINKAKKFVDDEIKLTEFYTNYYSKTGQWNKLDEFINRNLATHPEGWKIYLSYIIIHLVDNYPDKIITYLKKGFLLFPDQEYFAQFAVSYAQEYKEYDVIHKLLEEVAPKLQYDISGYQSDLEMLSKQKISE
ncbi:MAG TPA: tetratricopeptide repeat protein, partial [Candidatus Cloacimonas acidaminovorans]|nr:tetratricopeptide repeat protein [Candidatus Cloacimonas acidaminovorans]